MSENLKKLKNILREMFQLDQADLDFGIYRIMNQKRYEIEQFLDRDLLPQVKNAFIQFDGGRAELQKELDDKIKQYTADGLDPDTVPKVQELRRKIAEETVDVVALENDVFSQLTNFFRRYYQGGDFLSLRRYKAGVYAIPYEGEEVKLHWANADQYYIKSSESFRDYTFKLPSGKRAHFKLVEASTEQNNKKEQAGKERWFMICADTPVLEENGELFIRFEYKVDEEGKKQSALNEAAVQSILAAATEGWKRELATLAPTESNSRRTMLEKHLTDYTAKLSFDYFIHKDLGGFMRRELDFFIKNEILFIDDLDADHIKGTISKVKVIKEIGHKVIAFLEQLENFQKKLWLKKKFVVETGYCVTLDKVPEELYPAIIANAAQVEEWKRLFSIQEIEGDLHTPKYSVPLSMEFLKTNHYLVVDTAFFDSEFREKLLSNFDRLDEVTDGLMINSENFQALNLLQESYRNQIKSTYIDPPYNAAASEILYKNEYKHSSWNSLILDRIRMGKSLSTSDGIICVTIDDYELRNLWFLLGEEYGHSSHLGTALIRNNPQGRSTVKGFAVNHEFGLFFASGDNVSSVGRLERTEEQNARYNEVDEEGKRFLWENFRKTGTDSMRADRPKQYYPIYSDGNSYRLPQMRWNDISKEWVDIEPPSQGEKIIYPIDENNNQRVWKWGLERVIEKPHHIKVTHNQGDIQIYRRNYLNTLGALPGTWWDKAKYAAGSHGTNLLTNLFGVNHTFLFPKSVFAVEDCLKVCGTQTNSTVLDYFGGSGTTAHAIINLNREDKGNRKYILVEMGDYFDTVLTPRIKKIIYSNDWRDGKPVSREGSSHMFKYIRLESYEDALNNLKLKRTEAQQSLLDHHDAVREQYMLSYMLDVESAESASLLNIAAFTDPFNYRMNIARGNETRKTVVDLVETFNWLLGIKVFRISQKEYRTAEFEQDSEGRLQVKRRPRTCAAGEGWTFQEVEGQTLAGDKVLIIWRTCTSKPEQDNLMLDEWFKKRDYSTLDFEFSRIYVNGDNNLENLKIGEERWKVALIEQEFKRLMFAMEGV